MIEVKQGDCCEVMKTMPDESIDLIVTDPPYGYNFMNKDWDKAVPRVEIWKECLRVLKAGAFAFVMSAPRGDVQAEMILKLKEAGFEVGFSPIYWAYATGFPKALNVSKAVDKRLGFVRDKVPVTGGLAGGSGNTVGKFVGACVDEVPLSDEAKSLDGSFAGFQPKPAVEVILVAMKPCSAGGYLDQALNNGKGVTWLGNCRIPFSSDGDRDGAVFGTSCDFNQFVNIGAKHNDGDVLDKNYLASSDGRFPANLLVNDGVLDNGIISGSVGGVRVRSDANIYGKFDSVASRIPNDSGDFSLYFSLDAWWEQQIKSMPKSMRENIQKTFPFIVEPKAGASEKNEGCDDLEEKFAPNCLSHGTEVRLDGREVSKRTNFHPTVKPVDLMSYLVVLGSKKGDLVLDPFVGSGTTVVACSLMNRSGVGIELQPEYFKIAEARIKDQQKQTRLF
jgi:site-specific DNA-methyltransferase (adenine-specific)